MNYIVTVRMREKNPGHDPHSKKAGRCPVSGWCTDVTGEHHSFLMEVAGEDDVREFVRTYGEASGYRLTRIEDVLLEEKDMTTTAGRTPEQDPLRAIRQYDQGLEDDVSVILRVIERVDAHLDANTAQAYRDQPLAQDWARVAKTAEEAGEAVCAALLVIQHLTKNSGETWGIFLDALARAESRVEMREGQKP